METYEIVVYDFNMKKLLEKKFVGSLADAKRQATRDIHKCTSGLQVCVYKFGKLVAKRSMDTPRYPGFWMNLD